jgi:glycerol-3-phosphate dehydrogenase
MIKTGIKTITLDGLKFRTYAGFGMCQGAFCRWRIAKIVSEKLGVPLYDVTVKRTKYGIGDVKTLWVERKG